MCAIFQSIRDFLVVFRDFYYMNIQWEYTFLETELNINIRKTHFMNYLITQFSFNQHKNKTLKISSHLVPGIWLSRSKDISLSSQNHFFHTNGGNSHRKNGLPLTPKKYTTSDYSASREQGCRLYSSCIVVNRVYLLETCTFWTVDSLDPENETLMREGKQS